MTKDNPDSNPGAKLVGNLSIDDARHLLRNEGGVMTTTELAFEVVLALVLAATLARAIVMGEATAWHLFLPTVAQYFGLIAAIPVVYLVRPHPALRKDALKSVWHWVGLVVVITAVTSFRASRGGASFVDQLTGDALWIWNWILDAKMAWPILIAFVRTAMNVTSRAHNLHRYGPPFVGAGLGCAMRALLFIAGFFLLPFIVENSHRIVWILWGLFVLADILALYVHWDIQRRLSKLGLLDKDHDGRIAGI